VSIKLFVAVFLPLLIGHAQSPGTFTATGSMSTGRIAHTATLLYDGRVLITGGVLGVNSVLTGAELYDPSTGAFTPTGSMTSPRAYHTATLLPDGNVLIAGGWSGYTALATAELYNPTTQAFAPLPNMTTSRSSFTATLLDSGKVLITGGGPSGLGIIRSAELYDPAARSFTPTGDMTIARYNHRAILLATGKVLILPGGDGSDYNRADLYDPESGTFRSTGWIAPGNFSGVAHTANLLPSGKVLVTLAPAECDWTGADAQLYDPVTETFTATRSMIKARCYQAGTLLSDLTLLVSGTWGCQQNLAAELYNPASNSFALTGDLIVNRYSHTATLLNDGRVLLAGGVDESPSCSESQLAAAELYTPKSTMPAPVLLSVSVPGQGAVLHAGTHQLVSPDNPAAAGEALEIYLTGLIDGSVIPPQVAIGGRLAELLYFGKAPGYEGLNQVNVRVPGGITPGPAVPVRVNYIARPSNVVTIAIQ
jgi:Galactose oxidase, central domain